MFRDPPLLLPPEPCYVVCVLEAAAPSECPAKVKLSVRRQNTRCLAWGSGYKKVTTFRFAGESDLDTRDPAACPLRLPDSGWHTSHGLDPVTHTCHSRPPVLTSSSGPYPATSTSSPNCWPLLSSSGVPCPACTTSRNLDYIHSGRSVCGYGPTTSQCPGPITCTSQVACLNLESLLRAHGKAGEDSEMHVSITRRGGWKSTMYVPLEGFLQQLVRSGPAGKKFILRVRWEDKVIDVEAAALSLSKEMEALREVEFCGREMNVMATDAEDWRDWEMDEERQDQESYGRGENESDGEQETRRKEAFDKETEEAWEGNQGTRKKEALMGEREDAERTEEEIETDEKTKRKLEEVTQDEREWEGKIMTSKNIAMRETINTEHITEEFNIDITMRIKVNEPKKESKQRTWATPNEVIQEKEKTAQYHELSPGEMTASTGFSLCVYCLLLPLFVVSLILLLYVWVRDIPL